VIFSCLAGHWKTWRARRRERSVRRIEARAS